MWRLILLLTILSSNLIAGGDSELLTAEEMIAQAKEKISLDKGFQENLETLRTLKEQVLAAEKELSMDNNLSLAGRRERIKIWMLYYIFEGFEEFESFESLKSFDSWSIDLSENDRCERALIYIHVNHDPRSEIPRLEPFLKDFYNLIAKTCNLQQLD